MNQKHIILQGTLILTLAGFASRIIGFFYRIFLSHTIGAEGIGIYQLIFPVYAMLFSLTSSGIQTAVSRNVSGRMAIHDRQGARDIFLSGLFLTLLQTIPVSFFLYRNAFWIASRFLHETRCEELLRLLSFSIPFAGIHSCINGYYYGLRKTNISAISQLLEQVTRVGSSYLFYLIMLEKNLPVTPVLAVYGILCAEVAASLFSLTSILLHFGKRKQSLPIFPKKEHIKSLLSLSLPLTASRVLINLLQSMEAVCIPLRLQQFGLNVRASLETYGILTGMALPLVLFPSAITNAISVMLLPTVSEAQSAGQEKRISHTVEATIRYSLALGILGTGLFFCFGPDLGNILFSSPEAGDYILILSWICPFLYLNATLSSILNGLGKTMMTLWQNALSLSIRISFVWFAIPRFGISGYLWGLLASQLASSFLAVFILSRSVSFSIDSIRWIVKPVVTLLISTGIVFFLRILFFSADKKASGAIELSILSLFLCILYLTGVFSSDLLLFLSGKVQKNIRKS